MCGICGVVGDTDELLLRRMTAVIAHRGPDDEGVFVDQEGRAMLGARRLSIIDLVGGHQPIFNEDGSLCIVFNGEVYNFQDLRIYLEDKGHRFTSQSDTEVILHLYEEYGPACVHLLRGMFAFAIWDLRKRRLFIARDCLGKKPLYYWQGNGKLVFGSEIKAILEHPDVRREVDLEALQLYLALGYVPAPWTFFAGIKKLPPGHFLICEQGTVRIKQYWDVTFLEPRRQVRLADAIEEIRWRLEETVRLRLVSDVPLGVLLSGGLDSSTVLALMAKVSPKPVKTFAVGFDVGGWYNEFQEARLVAHRYQTDHRETVLSALDLPGMLPKIIWHLDEPIADPAALPTYLICEFARREVKAVLTGVGGDELFGGYPRYGWFRLAGWMNERLPFWTRSALLWTADTLPLSNWAHQHARLLLSNLSDEQRHLRWVGIFPHPELATLFRTSANGSQAPIDHLPEKVISDYLTLGPQASVVHRLMRLDIKTWLTDDILMMVDKMSMAVSLEARAPLLDQKLIEFLTTLPEELKVSGLKTKLLLKKAVADLLPESILKRPKHDFRVPIGDWFRGELRDYVSEHLLRSGSAVARNLNRDWIHHLVQEHQNGHSDHGRAIWTLLCFELWHRIFIDRETMG